MSSTNTESSVLANLGELMRLEEQRVQGELAAQRALEAEREAARREATRLAAEQVERARAEALARERAEQERLVALEVRREQELLRVRLEAEQYERAAREQAALTHQLELRRIELQAGGGHSRVATVVALVTAFAIVGALGVAAYVHHFAPALRASRARAAAAAAQAATYARESAELRERAARLEEQQRAASKLAVSPPSTQMRKAEPVRRPSKNPRPKPGKPRAAVDVLGDLGDDDDPTGDLDDDPLGGLTPASPKRRR